jgi:hypothetical protein
MKWIDDKRLGQVRAGDLETLLELDDRGLLMGPGETVETYADRLATLAKNIGTFEKELRDKGVVDFVDMRVARGDRIAADDWRPAQAQTEKLFGFSVDWVPGFYSGYRMGLLFAGCAFYTYEDFFAVFIVREDFRNRPKWLIYSRDELIAHELTHIAHIGFRTRNFEEVFAYQTSSSGFRKLLGGLLRTTTDTYLLMGATFTLLPISLVNTFWYPMPMGLVWSVFIAIILFIAGRYLVFHSRFRRALGTLGDRFGEDALAVLFRCSEEEIGALASMPVGSLDAWLAERSAADIRWRLIRSKFGPE